jgi:hypothetical protein
MDDPRLKQNPHGENLPIDEVKRVCDGQQPHDVPATILADFEI